MVEVVVTDEFKDWYASLGDQDAEAVEFVIGLLERQGVTLGYPYSSQLWEPKAHSVNLGRNQVDDRYVCRMLLTQNVRLFCFLAAIRRETMILSLVCFRV